MQRKKKKPKNKKTKHVTPSHQIPNRVGLGFINSPDCHVLTWCHLLLSYPAIGESQIQTSHAVLVPFFAIGRESIAVSWVDIWHS